MPTVKEHVTKSASKILPDGQSHGARLRHEIWAMEGKIEKRNDGNWIAVKTVCHTKQGS